MSTLAEPAAGPVAAGPVAGPVAATDLVPQPVPVEALRRSSLRHRSVAMARAYLALTKPRIVELLLVTTVPAMFLAAGGFSPLGLTVSVLVGGAFAAGAANAFNCYIDRDIDRLMHRTARRPLPSHTVSPRGALTFGITLATLSLVLLATTTNWLATGLTAAAIAYYDLIYTLWLKRSTPQNTFWGGVCGAAPVLIGWAAVTGGLAPRAFALFAIVFCWQMPHFYALAIKFQKDYARAGIPMLPVVASARRVAVETVVFSWLTVAASLALWPLGMTPVYGIAAVVLGVPLVGEAHRLAGRLRAGVPSRPMRLFHWSVTYLTLLFAAVAVDALIA